MKLTVLEAGRHKHIFSSRCFCPEFLPSFSTDLSIMKLTVLIAGRHQDAIRWVMVGPDWEPSFIIDRSIMKLTVLEAVRHKHVFNLRCLQMNSQRRGCSTKLAS